MRLPTVIILVVGSLATTAVAGVVKGETTLAQTLHSLVQMLIHAGRDTRPVTGSTTSVPTSEDTVPLPNNKGLMVRLPLINRSYSGSDTLSATSAPSAALPPTSVTYAEAVVTSVETPIVVSPTIGFCGAPGSSCPFGDSAAELVPRASTTIVVHPTIGFCGVPGMNCQGAAASVV